VESHDMLSVYRGKVDGKHIVLVFKYNFYCMLLKWVVEVVYEK